MLNLGHAHGHSGLRASLSAILSHASRVQDELDIGEAGRALRRLGRGASYRRKWGGPRTPGHAAGED